MTGFSFYCSCTKRYLKINSLISSSIIGYIIQFIKLICFVKNNVFNNHYFNSRVSDTNRIERRED